MNIPQIKYDTNNKPYVDGDFDFEIITAFDERSFEPYRKITFKWSPVLEQIQGGVSDKETMNLFFDKFKKDFIKKIDNEDRNHN